MASFFEDLWNSIFTPGPTPTLLVATNASFAALQFLLLILVVATYSIHFVVLSILSAGLWYSINWFAREVQLERAREESNKQMGRGKSPEGGSDTETEAPPEVKESLEVTAQSQSSLLQPHAAELDDHLRKRRSLGDNSGYVSTDSEWEKVSEGDDKAA